MASEQTCHFARRQSKPTGRADHICSAKIIYQHGWRTRVALVIIPLLCGSNANASAGSYAIGRNPQFMRFFLLCLAIVLPLSLGAIAGRAGGGHPNETHVSYDSRLILLARGALDTRTQAGRDTWIEDSSQRALNPASAGDGGQLRLIQFRGPVMAEWMRELKASGAAVRGYIPNNSYLIRADAEALRRVAALHTDQSERDDRPIVWMGRVDPIMKISPAFDEQVQAGAEAAVVEIELSTASDLSPALDRIKGVALSPDVAQRSFSMFTVVTAFVPTGELLNIAALSQVLFISPHHEPELLDERSSQIVAGNLSSDRTQPRGPGYMDWLKRVGLDAAGNAIIDVTDTGLDRGSTDASRLHPDFLDVDGSSRVVYALNYAEDLQMDDRLGHGTLVASVAAGSNASGRLDDKGYYFGLGVAPHAFLGSSRIFRNDGKIPPLLSFTAVASAAYAAGARISSNSWGQTGNLYDATAQEYDWLVRDAQPGVAGNQEMTFVFSAGNSGPGGRISSPSSAKNVISVAASENYRPEGTDSCDLDGKGAIGPDGANNALEILRFSSGGPVADGRSKPDITAPGTHVCGAISLSSLFNAAGLCPGLSPDQSIYPLYTWSSGTSLAAPHVSGAAALLRQFFKKSERTPSPALTKAYLANSASYLTGANAGGNLPSDRQGWGLLDLSQAFDETKRLLVDQTELLKESGQTFQVSGSLADRSRPLRVTLAWTDAPGTVLGSPWVNDLDLEVSINGTALYRGNNFNGEFSVPGGEPDRLNNVESVYLRPDLIPAGVEGNFTITVRAFNVAGDGAPGNGIDLDQDFALVVYNYAPPVEAPRVVVTAASYQGKSLLITGIGFNATAQVEVNGRILDRQFDFDATTGALSSRGKAKKLNLKTEADNQIVVVIGPDRSAPFTLRL